MEATYLKRRELISRVYIKDSNAAAHSVDSDIFYAVIQLSARFKT